MDSLLHPRAVEIRSLLHRSGRAQSGRILIDYEENIIEALGAGVRLVSLFHTGPGDEPGAIPEGLRRILPPPVTVHALARRTSKKLFGGEKASRLFAIAQAPAPRSLASLARSPRDLVVLEDVGIVGNIGAIIRTSLALGVGGVVLLDFDSGDVYERRLIRASRGYVFSLPVVCASTDALLATLGEHGRPLLVTTMQAPVDVGAIESHPERLAIAFGSEKRGCSARLVEAATLRVGIAIDPRVESLNVSAAAGIVLHRRSAFNRAAGGSGSASAG